MAPKSAVETLVGTTPAATSSGEALLVVDGLTLSVGSGPDAPQILQDVSFTVRAGEARAFVGESGSGKSLTLRAIMGILPPGVQVTAGTVSFEGQTIVTPGKDRRVAGRLAALRGAGISMIFQEPSVALNPVTTVGEQIIDAVRRRERMSRRESRDYALHLMELVGIDDPVSKIRAYPFELSGGLRQRVMIAAAVAGKPRLILCDEPTTALDVTIQQQILSLFTHLRDELDAALLYVTHDLAVVAQLCDTLTVLYSGAVMESRTDLRAGLDDPRHPYTRALLDSTPDIDLIGRRLRTIPGNAPTPAGRPDGCPFAPRCERVQNDCRSGTIPDVVVGDGAVVACLHPLKSSVPSGLSNALTASPVNP
jgi:peptide/nickel transport system ATP-binding protein